MSTNSRNKILLLCNILGLETVVDEIAANLFSEGAATPSAILSPFYRENAPLLPSGSSIIHNLTTSCPWYQTAIKDSVYITGRVLSSTTTKPIDNAIVDV